METISAGSIQAPPQPFLLMTSEERRSYLLSHQSHRLHPDEKHLARVEHECRTLNKSEHACERLKNGAHAACESCLRRSSLSAEA